MLERVYLSEEKVASAVNDRLVLAAAAAVFVGRV
jgi:hypothetical protein